MSTTQHTHHKSSSAGFSLVELLIAAVLMVISSIGGTALFNNATRQANAIHNTLQQQFTIANDLAAVLELNDRYVCTDTNCSIKREGNAPNQNEYISPSAADANSPFRSLCNSDLTAKLVEAINTSAKVAGPNVERLATDDNPSLPPHHYLVTWTSKTNGRVLRQVQLIPTVAAWCP